LDSDLACQGLGGVIIARIHCMPKYLYVFAYQTPAQVEAAANGGYTEEASAAVFIEAESAEQALGWGQQISEDFLNHLFPDRDISWKSLSFAHWIEVDPQEEYPTDLLEKLPVVACGVRPEFNNLRQ
jgi:hypothetical protein